MHNVTTFDIDSDVVIIGQNPEMADYDNPRGHLYGLAYYVRARNEHGDTWSKHVVTGRPGEERELSAKADKLAAALQARLDRLGKLPVDAARWVPGRAVYGSAAYVEYGQADDVALEARELEDERWGF